MCQHNRIKRKHLRISFIRTMLFIYQMGKFELCMTFEVTTTKIARVYNRGDLMISGFYGPPTAEGNFSQYLRVGD